MATTISLTQYLDIVTPAWLKGTWGKRWITGLGGQTDGLKTWAKDAIKSRMPTEAPSGALPYLGRERGLERLPSETDASYRARIWAAWDTWVWSGTDLGIYYGLQTCGLTIGDWSFDPSFTWPDDWPDDGNVWLVPYSMIVGQAPDGDDVPTHAGREWIVIDGHAEGIVETPHRVGGSNMWVGISGLTIGLGGDASVIALWRRSIQQWKGAHMTCPKIFLILSNGRWTDIVGPFGHLVGSGATIGATIAEVIVGEAS